MMELEFVSVLPLQFTKIKFICGNSPTGNNCRKISQQFIITTYWLLSVFLYAFYCREFVAVRWAST